MQTLTRALALALLFVAATARANPPPAATATVDATAAEAQARERAISLLRSLSYRTGDLSLPEAHASLHVRPGFRFLGRADAGKVIEKLWGNPPRPEVLGMLVPDDAPLSAPDTWAVVLTYVDEGHVSDEDATSIDYAQVMADMKKDSVAANAQRKQAGYVEVGVVGWAQPPYYDATGKRIYWARELDFHDGHHTLNYDIRVLGREGYLSLNAVARMSDLETVKAGMGQVLAMAEFDAGYRYDDYVAGSDRRAPYGLAALVGGNKQEAKASLPRRLAPVLGIAALLVLGVWFLRRARHARERRSGGRSR